MHLRLRLTNTLAFFSSLILISEGESEEGVVRVLRPDFRFSCTFLHEHHKSASFLPQCIGKSLFGGVTFQGLSYPSNELPQDLYTPFQVCHLSFAYV